jgi:hypothetical protein
MTMKPQPETAADAGGTTPDEHVGRKAYQRPTVRVLGAVHLMTRGAAETANGDGGQMMRVSDRALKQDLVRIGDHPLGIGLYLFRYKPDCTDARSGRQFGVMADEVETVMPQAVSVHPDGYKMVDYAMLGITQAGQ